MYTFYFKMSRFFVCGFNEKPDTIYTIALWYLLGRLFGKASNHILSTFLVHVWGRPEITFSLFFLGSGVHFFSTFQNKIERAAVDSLYDGP